MNHKLQFNTKKEMKKNLTEPAVAGLLSDCCGAITETILLDICFMHLGIENGDDVEGKADNLTSFCDKKSNLSLITSQPNIN